MKYTPSSFFRTLRNDILKPIFDTSGIILEGIDWEKRDPAKDKTVGTAWEALRSTLKPTDGELNEATQNVAKAHEVFQCISELAKPIAEVTALAHQFEEQHRFTKPLPEDFDSLTRQEQAATIYLAEGRKILLALVDAAYAKSININRWVEFGNAPQKPIQVSQEMKDALAKEIDAIFGSDKGGNCHVETYPLDDGVIYFLGKMDDKPELIEIKAPGDDDYRYTPVIRPSSLILAYDYEKGKLSMHGTLSKKKMTALAAKASQLITGEESQLSRMERATYDLTDLARLDYTFPALPGTGLKRIYIKTLVLRPDCAEDAEVTFKNIGIGSAYDSMEEYHHGYQLPDGTFTVIRASIIMEFENADQKAIKFELTPKTCTQTGLLDSQRKLVEQLVEKMGVERR